MRRLKNWIPKPSSLVVENIDKVNNSTLYVLRENGPTFFVLKDGNKTFKVSVGNENNCTCNRTHPCVHHLFVMLKIFRLPQSNALIWQESLLDSEINKILSGRFLVVRRALNGDNEDGSNRFLRKKEASVKVKRKKITAEDMCSICYDEMINDNRFKLTYCKCCGNNIHRKCMKIWVQHREKTLDDVTCPLCRGKWSASDVFELKKRSIGSISCEICKKKIKKSSGRYKCDSCKDYSLCKDCFCDNYHNHHDFKRCKNGRWIPAKGRKKLQFTDPAKKDLLSLQFREINENDYESLMDGLIDIKRKKVIPDYLVKLIPKVVVKEDNKDEFEGCSCPICLGEYNIGENVMKLHVCSHEFHEDCLETWLIQHNNSCPVCKSEIFPSNFEDIVEVVDNEDPNMNGARVRKKKRKKKFDKKSGKLLKRKGLLNKGGSLINREKQLKDFALTGSTFGEFEDDFLKLDNVSSSVSMMGMKKKKLQKGKVRVRKGIVNKKKSSTLRIGNSLDIQVNFQDKRKSVRELPSLGSVKKNNLIRNRPILKRKRSSKKGKNNPLINYNRRGNGISSNLEIDFLTVLSKRGDDSETTIIPQRSRMKRLQSTKIFGARKGLVSIEKRKKIRGGIDTNNSTKGIFIGGNVQKRKKKKKMVRKNTLPVIRSKKSPFSKKFISNYYKVDLSLSGKKFS